MRADQSLPPKIAGVVVLASMLTFPLVGGCGSSAATTRWYAGDHATAGLPSTTAASGASPSGSGPARITTTTIDLPVAFSYLRTGYNATAVPSKTAVSVAQNGTGQVAWLAGDGVHVTPLSASLERAGADVVVSGAKEVGGLVAHDNGFALLTRMADSNKWNETAAYLVRYSAGKRTFAVALTGAKAQKAGQDTAPDLGGELAWNGSRYGAYFVVHGAGGFADGHFGDKLVYVDDRGQFLSGGWAWGCSHNEGTGLVATASGAFASVCCEDWRSGVFVSTRIGGQESAPVIAREECWAGYCGATIGGFVRSPSGRYAVALASRGDAAARKDPADSSGRGWKVTARWKTHQVAVAFLTDPSTVAGKPVYLTSEPETDHVNVRVAPYGADRFIVTWETVAAPRCASGTCTGTYSGTHAQVIDGSGAKVGAERTIAAPLAGPITTLASGELVFASAGTPSYASALKTSQTTRKLTMVRMAVSAG